MIFMGPPDKLGMYLSHQPYLGPEGGAQYLTSRLRENKFTNTATQTFMQDIQNALDNKLLVIRFN